MECCIFIGSQSTLFGFKYKWKVSVWTTHCASASNLAQFAQWHQAPRIWFVPVPVIWHNLHNGTMRQESGTIVPGGSDLAPCANNLAPVVTTGNY